MEDWRREARREERAKAKVAIAKAEKEKAQDMAAKLKTKNMALDEIAELTGLSIDEIQSL